jgi:hypothetical protein
MIFIPCKDGISHEAESVNGRYRRRAHLGRNSLRAKPVGSHPTFPLSLTAFV